MGLICGNCRTEHVSGNPGCIRLGIRTAEVEYKGQEFEKHIDGRQIKTDVYLVTTHDALGAIQRVYRLKGQYAMAFVVACWTKDGVHCDPEGRHTEDFKNGKTS